MNKNIFKSIGAILAGIIVIAVFLVFVNYLLLNMSIPDPDECQAIYQRVARRGATVYGMARN